MAFDDDGGDICPPWRWWGPHVLVEIEDPRLREISDAIGVLALAAQTGGELGVALTKVATDTINRSCERFAGDPMPAKAGVVSLRVVGDGRANGAGWLSGPS